MQVLVVRLISENTHGSHVLASITGSKAGNRWEVRLKEPLPHSDGVGRLRSLRSHIDVRFRLPLLPNFRGGTSGVCFG